MTVHIPTPHECGLPEKFEAWRPAQQEAIRHLMRGTKRVSALCAPTGFGKSPVAMAAALLSKRPTCFVTESRGLQDQLLADFGECGLVDLRGRRNYKCDLKPDATCEDGYASRCPYKGTAGCPASQAEMRAAASYLVVTNYDKWTSTKMSGQGLEHIQQVVFDEGHEAPAALARAMQVTLNHKEIEGRLGINFLPSPEADEFVNWKDWAAEARAEAEYQMLVAREKIKHGGTNIRTAWVRDYTHLRHLTRRLATLANANPNNWVVDEAREGYQFDPIRPGRYSEAALLLRVQKILVISATLRPKTLYMMGIEKAHFDFQEFNSDFDPKRCPIYYVPTMRVDKNAHDLSQLWLKLDQIAARRTDRKGIVHTISYARRNEVLQASRFSPHMMVNEKGEAATDMVEMFKQSPEGTILVSPSMGAGYDFPGKQCEFQFVCKIPFPDGRSKILKARQEDDKEYGPYQAMNKLVQIFGRGMRSKADQCENFIVDSHLDWFLPRYGHLAPKSFHGFFKQVSVVPPPPTRL